MEIKTEKQTKEVKVYVKTTDEYAYSIWFTNDFDEIYSSKEECRLNKEICKDDFFFHCFKNGEYVKSVDGDCGFACPKREMSKFDTIIEHGPDCDMVFIKNFSDTEIEKHILNNLDDDYCLESDLEVQQLKLKSSGELEPEDIIDAYAKLEEVELESNGELGSIEVVETIKEYILVSKENNRSDFTHWLVSKDNIQKCKWEYLGVDSDDNDFGDCICYYNGHHFNHLSLDNGIDGEFKKYDIDITNILLQIENSEFSKDKEYGWYNIESCSFTSDGKKITVYRDLKHYEFFDYALIIEEA